VVVLETLRPHFTYARTIAVVLVVATLCSFYIDWSQQLQPSKNSMASQAVLLEATQWMNQNLPPNSLVGSFAPGIEGYFSTQHLIDLDGWINNNAEAAMAKHQLWQYIQDQHIQYISDYGMIGLTYRYKSFLGISDPYSHLQQLGSGSSTLGTIGVYKIIN
jgi:hypothetical protein